MNSLLVVLYSLVSVEVWNDRVCLCVSVANHRLLWKRACHFAPHIELSMARKTGFAVGLRETIYNLTMRRNSVYVTFLVIGGFAATKFMGAASDYVWETYNKGVSGRYKCSEEC